MDQHILTEKLQLAEVIKNISPEKIFLVHGKRSFVLSGAEQFLSDLLPLEQAGSFSDFATNPQLSDLERGCAIFREKPYELIIAIGGGSVMDMAKLISIFAHQSGEISDYILHKKAFQNKKTTLIAIPTTSGSGAEATHFSVLYIGKQKYSVASPLLLPETVFLTPEFSMKASPYLTACTGMDALSQAVEALWSVNSNETSRTFALEAIELIWPNLHEAVTRSTKAAKAAISKGAFLAGSAINITKTTAPHAFSYAFTSYYGTPHGHAVALSLPFFLGFNAAVNQTDCVDSRGETFVKQEINQLFTLTGIHPDRAEKELDAFINSLGLVTDIATLIPDFSPEILAENLNFERLRNNPRRVTTETVTQFLNRFK